ncbi:MAG TPA: hypothetical protein DEO92_09355 [Phycisphaerales bacterium]|nr:hypothetical protein [Phycisphaerales bacterium]
MTGPTDKVAKLAAAIFHRADMTSLRRAIEEARVACGGGPLPSMATVRRHLEALRQSSIGMDEWVASRLGRLEAIDELLQTVAFIGPDSVCYVVGRAAEGHVDDTGPAHLRLVGSRESAMVIDDLESQGFSPCEVSSVTTRLGSVAVVHLDDGDLRVDLMLLPDVPAAHAAINLVNGRPVALEDEVGFAKLIQKARGDSSVS